MSAQEPLVVGDVHAEGRADGIVLSARLEAPGLGLPSTMWFHYPPSFAPFVVSNGDPFLPVALLAAMRHGRRLIIQSDVSSALLAASSRIMGHYRTRGADEPRFEQIEIVAASAPRTRRGRGAGLFFSCGVDSFYTLLGNVARYPDDDSRAISHLVFVHGFDIALEEQGFFETVRGQVDVVARALGKTVVPVRTNVRDVLGRMDWAHHAVGPAMAGVGLSLGWLFHTLFMASARAFVDLRPVATGCHPGLDPLWSTETLEFVHAGAEAKKADKIAAVASSPLALRVLRVCWENRGGAYNCGRCEKCLRTMVLLDLHGVLGETGQFPHRLDADEVAALDLRVGWWGWLEILARVRAAGDRPALVEAIETALARRAWTTSPLGRVDAAARRLLAGVGLSPTRLRGLDRMVLGGRGRRLFGAARRSLIRARTDT
ncbi:MAG TPA: hypothetical protein VHF87_15965 [Methylomirabilota bacterium]|nr:hypothetical protein [Methylomirabilota bacterium]